MKHSNRLVGFGVLFIIAGGIIYVTQEAQDASNGQVILPAPPSFSSEGALSHLLPLISSGSVEKIAELLASLPIDEVEKIVNQIINDQSLPLDRDDKIQLLSNLAFLHKLERAKQEKFFKLLIENKLFQEGIPLLFAIAKGNYEKIIPDLFEWLEEYNLTILKVIVDDAINYAIEHDQFTEFDRLHNYGVFIPPHRATTLLWEVVDRNNDYHFLSPLLQAGADINAVYEKDGKKYTLLIRATELNNIKAVKTLLEAGANVNAIPDPAVGSALQIAVVKRFGAIDLLLRQRGARE